MADKWSRTIKLDVKDDEDVIEAAERLGPTMLFRQAVRYYVAREPYAVFPERVEQRKEFEKNETEQIKEVKETPIEKKTTGVKPKLQEM
ncbi:hypothetical protein LC087_19210 (plasmid) [Bacillus carboniphilus]|uniref:Uncharacterized protein n=1 Tax=Bacillus carboniphilus TaxID=86663 RepID=A0ABY9K0D3_9BACI|nr:hypothetical protein [Bacillus carboniphilus]WLR44498.1 hypothetical protein LC087_19210 [Bacillus carboniphilus]